MNRAMTCNSSSRSSRQNLSGPLHVSKKSMLTMMGCCPCTRIISAFPSSGTPIGTSTRYLATAESVSPQHSGGTGPPGPVGRRRASVATWLELARGWYLVECWSLTGKGNCNTRTKKNSVWNYRWTRSEQLSKLSSTEPRKK